MAKHATVFRHMIDNDLGTLAPVLDSRNITVTQIDTFADSLDSFDPLAPDLLIVLGGSCAVYQSREYPFLKTEEEILKKRLAADKPTLGICLGAQLMASALGASVYKSLDGPEIGWMPLDVNPAGQQTAVRHFDANITAVAQWHGDTFDLPDGAVLLASSAKLPQQIFQWGRNCLGLQCHVEATRSKVRSWCVNMACGLDLQSFDLNRIQKDADQWADILQAQTEKFFNEWLDQVGV